MVTETKKIALLSDKVARLKESLLQSEPMLCTERLKFLRDSYRETEGEAPVIRRARLFEKVLTTEMTIYIDDNPIVGTMTKYRLGALPLPEYSCAWMKESRVFTTGKGKGEVTDEEAQNLLAEAANYWHNKCVRYKTSKIWSQKHPDIDYEELRESGVFTDPVSLPRGRICVDYGKVVRMGLEGVIEEAKDELAKLPVGTIEAWKKRDFLNAVIIAGSAMIKFAGRYASLAHDMAKVETDSSRAKELQRIAETCRWVPAKPARTFYEGLQSVWFTHLGTHIERLSAGHTLGRFALYTYPLYKKDKQEGKITEEEAIELLQLFFIKFNEIVRFQEEKDVEEAAGSLYQNISLGGVTTDGEDATNEVDYLLLEAQRQLRLPQPTLSVLYHDKMPEDFLVKAAEVVKTGLGMPAFFNNDVTVARLLSHGASLEDARNCCIIGCVEGGFSHTANSMAVGAYNMAKFLELALNNGRDPLTGKQLGPQTGNAEDFQSYEQLHEAMKTQLQYFVPLNREFVYTGAAVQAELLPTPFASALVDDCIKQGKDIAQGGARYYMDGGGPVATIDLADSLAAIKKLVFEDKKITMRQLLEALKANFEGYEEVWRMLHDAPKYGNDDDYVDKIAKESYSIFYQEHQRFRDFLGNMTRPVAISITWHFPFGVRTGALPSGRKASLALADGTVSACPGMDKKGPTALIRSATKVIDTTKYACNLLNMKLHPTTLKDRPGLKKLLALIKTYMDLGGHHIQFNVVSSETLRDAQLHPEKYRDLVVRVAGFSAFFIYLDPVVQNEIIKRTEVTLEG